MAGSKTKFVQPSKSQCFSAIGITEAQPVSLKHQEVYKSGISKATPQLLRALVPGESFQIKRAPKCSDWLASISEPGQTFVQFSRAIRNTPTSIQDKIYILPLTFFEQKVPEDITEHLIEFASRFFCMPVHIMKTKSLSNNIDSRKNDGVDQVNARQVLNAMKKFLPRDAFCMAGLTLCDLYPENDWNFVFGLASLSERAGVYSLARHMPKDAETQQQMTESEKRALLRRACALMCHEISHMFGMKHCIYYECLLNGSMHFTESDGRPLALCPVCLRKLHFVRSFEPLERYARLLEFAREQGLDEVAEWYEKRMQEIT